MLASSMILRHIRLVLPLLVKTPPRGTLESFGLG